MSGLVPVKLRYRTAMDHVEHVPIFSTSMPIRIARRIRGEVKAFAASPRVTRHVAAVCETVGSTCTTPVRQPGLPDWAGLTAKMVVLCKPPGAMAGPHLET